MTLVGTLGWKYPFKIEHLFLPKQSTQSDIEDIEINHVQCLNNTRRFFNILERLVRKPKTYIFFLSYNCTNVFKTSYTLLLLSRPITTQLWTLNFRTVSRLNEREGELEFRLYFCRIQTVIVCIRFLGTKCASAGTCVWHFGNVCTNVGMFKIVTEFEKLTHLWARPKILTY